MCSRADIKEIETDVKFRIKQLLTFNIMINILFPLVHSQIGYVTANFEASKFEVCCMNGEKHTNIR